MSTRTRVVSALSPIAQSFVSAFNEYCGIAARNFNQPICGEKEDVEVIGKKVLSLFKQCPVRERHKLFFVALHTISATAGRWSNGKIDWELFESELYWQGDDNLINKMVEVII